MVEPSVSTFQGFAATLPAKILASVAWSLLFRPDVAVHVAALSEVGGQAFSLIVAITSRWVGASGPCWFMKNYCQEWHTTFPVAACLIISEHGPAVVRISTLSWQILGSNSQRAPFQTLRLLRGPDWPGDPLTLLQLRATWWPEPVVFISFALQILTKPLWVWAWKRKNSKLFADKHPRGCGSPNQETSCRILVFCAVDLTPHDSGQDRLSDVENIRQSVHMYLRQQEYTKIRITTVNAHLLAGMHNLSTHNGLASEDSAGLSS